CALCIGLVVLAFGCGDNASSPPGKALTSFALTDDAGTLVAGVIDESAKTIAVTLPYGNAVTGLVATFTTTGEGVTVGSTAPVTGTTSNDFTGPVVYTVNASDGTTAQYSV